MKRFKKARSAPPGQAGQRLGYSVVIPSPLNDPVTALCVSRREGGEASTSRTLCLAGTLFGRVLLFSSLGSQGADAADELSGESLLPARGCFSLLRRPVVRSGFELPRPAVAFQTLAAAADDAIRAVWSDQAHAAAIVGNWSSLHWRIAPSPPGTGGCAVLDGPSTIRLDRRISSTLKYVLRHHKYALVPSTGVTVLFDLQTRTSSVCPFRLPDKDIVPCDLFCPASSEESLEVPLLLVISHHSNAVAALKVLQLPSDRGGWAAAENRFNLIVKDARALTHARFWGGRRVVFTNQGRFVSVHDWRTGDFCFRFCACRRDIVIVEARNADALCLIDRLAELSVWNARGEPRFRRSLPYITFLAPVPFFAESAETSLFFTSDQGVIHTHWADEHVTLQKHESAEAFDADATS